VTDKHSFKRALSSNAMEPPAFLSQGRPALGFHPVATHDVCELQSRSRRIALVLDLRGPTNGSKPAATGVRYLTDGWPDALHRRLAV
jgi:hypothetical protein